MWRLPYGRGDEEWEGLHLGERGTEGGREGGREGREVVFVSAEGGREGGREGGIFQRSSGCVDLDMARENRC